MNPPTGWNPPWQQPSPSPGQGGTKAQLCFGQAHPDLGLTSVRYFRQCHTLGLGDTGITHWCHPLPGGGTRMMNPKIQELPAAQEG